MTPHPHDSGDCSLTCQRCAWEDEQEAAERAEETDCGSCPFAGCDDCAYQGGE